jgi:hypothetical protein
VQKVFTYSLLLAAALGLSACDETPENKTSPARGSAAESVKPMNEPFKDGADATGQKYDQRMGNDPANSEKIENPADDMFDSPEDTDERRKGTVGGD